MWNSWPGDLKTREIRRFSEQIKNVLQETLFENISDLAEHELLELRLMYYIQYNLELMLMYYIIT